MNKDGKYVLSIYNHTGIRLPLFKLFCTRASIGKKICTSLPVKKHFRHLRLLQQG